MVDTRRSTLVLPINGFAVPFHINTLKSAIKQEEGEHTVLRFMFTTPGAITGKKEDTVSSVVSVGSDRSLTVDSLTPCSRSKTLLPLSFAASHIARPTRSVSPSCTRRSTT